jgi:hypothetical protein
VVASVAAIGCGTADAPSAPAACLGPAVESSEVSAIPGNVLGAVVTTHVLRADSLVVHFARTTDTDTSRSAAVRPSADSAGIPVLGLWPDAPYTMRVAAYGACGTALGTGMSFATGSLPTDLPSYTAAGDDPSPGYVAFAAGSYGVVIDNSGRVVWYHHFDGGVGLNFQPQPTGRYVARPPSSDPSSPWVEIDPLGRMTRTLGCAHGLTPRLHDLIEEASGAWWVMCDEVRTVDLTAIGGGAADHVSGTGVQYLAADGAVLFEWSPFDHLSAADADPLDMVGSAVNWTHGNALALDVDGNLLVSFRNLSTVVKIDTRTGAVLWQLGGAHNDFALDGTTDPPFRRQHGVRVAGPGEILLLDNLGEPDGSRAERYELDEQHLTARLAATYHPASSVTAQIGGTTQRLDGGRVLVSFGSGGAVEEYGADGRVVWRMTGTVGYVFRAQRIRSLYAPGAAP